MKFSVIIPARTINDNLKETVSHLKKIRYYDYEVVIVLDEFVKVNFGPKETRFKVIDAGQAASPGLKRNLGAQASSGDVLAFLDDDAYPDSGWLRAAANIFEEIPDLYALGGPALTPSSASFEEKMAGRILESQLTGGETIYRHKPEKRREVDDFPSVNLFIKKEAFNAVGGFDTQFWPGEDTKLCLDLVKHFKKKFIYDPEPIVYHHRRPLFKPFFQQVSRYGQHRGQFARVFPKNSRRLIYFIPSFFVLGLVFGFFLMFITPKIWMFYFLTLFVYSALIFTEAQKVTMEEKDFRSFKYVMFGIIGTNIVYGINFLIGLLFKPRLKLRDFNKVTGNYIGG